MREELLDITDEGTMFGLNLKQEKRMGLNGRVALDRANAFSPVLETGNGRLSLPHLDYTDRFVPVTPQNEKKRAFVQCSADTN